MTTDTELREPDGPECETCGKTTCPDADLPEFSEPRACEYAPVYRALRDARDCDYGCARDYTNQAIRLEVVGAVGQMVATYRESVTVMTDTWRERESSLRQQIAHEAARADAEQAVADDACDRAEAAEAEVERLRGPERDTTAVDVIERYGRDPETLLYVDPPYFGPTRTRTGYAVEMNGEADHRELAEALRSCKATVMLSGYPHPLYDEDLYADWHRVEISAYTGQSNTGLGQRTEVIWSNRRIGEPDLFAEVTP